ncbi:MAG: hypothetical protein ACRYGL_08705 [Janthinobacterium lividum]
MTNLDPRAYGYRNVLRVFGMASKLLKGGHADASDMLDVLALQRNAMSGEWVVAASDELSETRSMRFLFGETGEGAPDGAPGLRLSAAHGGAPARMRGEAAPAATGMTGPTAPRPDEAPAMDDMLQEKPPPQAARADAGAARVTARENAPSHRNDEPASFAVPRFAWRLNGNRERSSFEEADTAYDMTQGPLLYTRVGNVPLLGRRQGRGTVSWESMPQAEYAAPLSIPAGAPQQFDVSGRAYVGIDGVAYRVREIEPGTPWIVHEHSGWPPLPLTRDPAGHWVLKIADLTPAGIEGDVASDGFLRMANRKFIRVKGVTVEVSRDFIFGEEDIRRFARLEMSRLEAADASGVIRLADGTELIEGRHGYYALRRDGETGPYYVGDGAGRHWVRFDAARKRWNVVPGEAEPGVMERVLKEHGDTVDGMHRLSPSGRRESMRKNSEHSVDSVRRYQDRIGKIDFLQARPMLRTAIDEAFQGIVDLNVRRPNRLVPGGDLSAVVSTRRIFFDKTYQTAKWQTLTIQQKQRFVSEKVFTFYAQALYLPHRPKDALCHEMTDFMAAQLMQSATLRAKILQIEFRELPGSGLGHAAVLFADNPAVLSRLGRLEETDLVRQQARPRLNRAEFLAFVHANRNRVLLIDPWGLEKIVDFSAMTSAEDCGRAIDVNLHAAGFGEGLNDHYRVAALLPELPRARPEPNTAARSRSLPSSPSRNALPSPGRWGTAERRMRLVSDGPKHGQRAHALGAANQDALDVRRGGGARD